MTDSAKGWKQGRNPELAEKEVWLTAAEVGNLIGVSARAVRDTCNAGLYPGARKARINGGEGWQIPISGLPPSTRLAWYARQRKISAADKPKRLKVRDRVSPTETAIPNDQAYRDALWEAFWKATENQRTEASRRAEIVLEFNRLEGDGARQAEIFAILADRFDKGINRATVWRYKSRVKGQAPDIWAPLLLPVWKGKTGRAEFSEEALEYIKGQYLIQSQPSLRQVYDVAMKIAEERGWIIPSYDTVQARLNELPHDYVVLKREGRKALERTFAHQVRDYSGLELHELWNADGHKADVWVKDKAGVVFRPIVVAFQDVRSRKFLGWVVGKSETAELVRRALHASIVSCGNVIPRRVLMDNGMAFAAKENTGGAPNRHRFKVKENELPGTMTLLGIEYIWATPGHGQAKPIEPAWRALTEMAKRKEFEGAYCGNRPDARPENFNVKNAVPLAGFMHILEETFHSYNARGHRGDSMHGKSPQQVYEALLPATVVRHPSAEQVRYCLLATEPVRLDRENGSFEVLKNRYWGEECSALARIPGYSVRYDPNNPSAPVHLFLNGRYLMDVPLYQKTGFNDREAAKEHGRRKRAYVASVKNADHAREKLYEAENPDFSLAEEASLQASTSPKPKVVEPVRLPLVIPPAASPAEDEDSPLITPEGFAGLLEKKFNQQSR